MEQLVARRAHNPKVEGSSPSPATKQDSSPVLVGSFLFVPPGNLLTVSLRGIANLQWRLDIMFVQTIPGDIITI